MQFRVLRLGPPCLQSLLDLSDFYDSVIWLQVEPAVQGVGTHVDNHTKL